MKYVVTKRNLEKHLIIQGGGREEEKGMRGQRSDTAKRTENKSKETGRQKERMGT